MLNSKKVLNMLANYQPQLLEATEQSAAVMVIFLVDDADQIEIVLTQRALTLLTYAGDYSFPGGIKESSDNNLYETAVRETQEELNILPGSYQKIGDLDDFKDRYDRLVRPFVVAMKKSDFLKLYKGSDTEIISVYLFPFTRLQEIKDNPDLSVITRRKPSYSFRDGDVFVWGLTATILVHITNIINNLHKPLGKVPNI